MVQISDEEFMARKRGDRGKSIDGLSKWDIEQIGAAVRVHLPMTDRLTLELAADLLRGFANEIEFTLQRDDIPLRQRLQMLKTSASFLNRRIRDRFEQSTAGLNRTEQ